MTEQDYARPELLAEPEWLSKVIDDPHVRVVDCSGMEGYRRAHIPSAVGLPLNWIKDPERKAHVMPAQTFAALMEMLGIGEHTTVVAYDDVNGMLSARLWWVLAFYGHTRAKVLNGGWQRWMHEGRPVSRDRANPAPARFTPQVNASLICRLDELRACLEWPDVVLLDVRSRGEWTGEDRQGNHRGGHLPGARHHDWLQTTTADERRVFRPAAELRYGFEDLGATPDKEIVTYCQVGLRAAHQAFVLALLGYERVRNYDASMFEWANRDDTPLVEGD